MTYTKHLLSLLLVMATLTGFSQNKKGDISLSITASPFPTTNSNSNDFGVIAKAGMEFHISDNVSFQGSFFTSNNVLFKNESGININSYGGQKLSVQCRFSVYVNCYSTLFLSRSYNVSGKEGFTTLL